jgi:hypothetical protein
VQKRSIAHRTNFAIAKETAQGNIAEIALEKLGIKIRLTVKPLPTT